MDGLKKIVYNKFSRTDFFRFMFKGKYFLSYRTKILLLLGGLGFIFVLGTIIFIENRLERIVRRQLAEKLLAIVSSAAESIPGSEHSLLVSSEQENSPQYQRIKSYLQNVRQRFREIKYIYTARIKNNQLIFVVDADTSRTAGEKNLTDPSAAMVHIGDIYDANPEKYPEALATFYDGVARTTSRIVHDRWGTWLSAFAPIRDQSGRIEGILCADMSVDNVLTAVGRIRREVLILYLLIFLPGVILAGWLIGRKLFQPIQKLARAATLISFGDYSRLVKVESNDELGYLSEVFNEMAHKIVRERGRLADELHDGPAQVLASINWKLDMVSRLIKENRLEEANQLVASNQQLLITAIADIRKSIYELHRQEISQVHFQDIVKKHLEDFTQETGIKVESQVTLPTDIPVELKIDLYRIIGEIFTNIKKHSRASWVQFNLHFTGDSDKSTGDLVLSIINDGTGFDPDRTYPGHFGLKSIKNRVRSFGGTIDISSSRGPGKTRIVLTIPLKTKNDLWTKVVNSLSLEGEL